MRALILCLVPFFNANAGLVDGIAELRQGNQKAGYQIIEESFLNSTDKKTKAKAAYLLSHAQEETIKTKPAYFAKYALKYYSPLSADETANLHRKIADDMFKEGDIRAAKLSYQEINKLLPITHDLREYATYKLGWINVNLEDYRTTYGLYTKQIKEHPKGLLIDNMMSDLGKFWIEDFQKSNKITSIDPLFLSSDVFRTRAIQEAKKSKFKNIKRLKNSSDILMAGVYTQLAKYQCQNIKQFKSIHFSLLGEKVANSLINKCFDKIKSISKWITQLSAGPNKLYYTARNVKSCQSLNNFLSHKNANSSHTHFRHALSFQAEINGKCELKNKKRIVKNIENLSFENALSKDIIALENFLAKSKMSLKMANIKDNVVKLAYIKQSAGDKNFQQLISSVSKELTKEQTASLIADHFKKLMESKDWRSYEKDLKGLLDKKLISKQNHQEHNAIAILVNQGKWSTPLGEINFKQCTETEKENIKNVFLASLYSKESIDLDSQTQACITEMVEDDSTTLNHVISLLIDNKRSISTCHSTLFCTLKEITSGSDNSNKKLSFNNKKTTLGRNIVILNSVQRLSEKLNRLNSKSIPQYFRSLKWVNRKLRSKDWSHQQVLEMVAKAHNSNVKLFIERIQKAKGLNPDQKELLAKNITNLEVLL